jgi:hypothetical protein
VVKIFAFFFFIIPVSGLCLFMYTHFSNLVCWVRGNSLVGRVMYTSCLYLSAVGLAGRYNFIWAQWWSGRRDCTDFLLLWLCSGGYSTGEMVRGVVRFSLCFSSVCCQFSWRMDIGRNIVLYFLLVNLFVFLRFLIL